MPDWCLEIWGDYACFTRPEMKVERVSYDVITPSAARGIFEAIMWKPEIRWNITKIEVLNPIKWTTVRRNEVGKTISPPRAKEIKGESNPPEGIFIEDHRQQRTGLILKDVRYRIHGYFDIIDEESKGGVSSKRENTKSVDLGGKYSAIFERRAKNGQCFNTPYLGTREFSCFFKLVNEGNDPPHPIEEDKDLGFMLYDIAFERDRNNPPPLFFRAEMKKGVILTDRRKLAIVG